MIKHFFPRNRQFNRKRKMPFKGSCTGILLMCLAVQSGSFGQELFKKEQQKKIDSVLLVFKEKDKFKYLNLLPQVSYDALNNSFNVGLSLNNLSNYFQQKQRNKIELAKLEFTLNERLENQVEKINLDILEIEIEIQNLKNKLSIHQIDSDLYKISKGKYENSEISLEDFLKLKKDFLSKKNVLKNECLKLNLKANRINQKIKSESLEDSLNTLSNSINNND